MAENWKQYNCLSTGELINSSGWTDIPTTEYKATKKELLVTHSDESQNINPEWNKSE